MPSRKKKKASKKKRKNFKYSISKSFLPAIKKLYRDGIIDFVNGKHEKALPTLLKVAGTKLHETADNQPFYGLCLIPIFYMYQSASVGQYTVFDPIKAKNLLSQLMGDSPPGQKKESAYYHKWLYDVACNQKRLPNFLVEFLDDVRLCYIMSNIERIKISLNETLSSEKINIFLEIIDKIHVELNDEKYKTTYGSGFMWFQKVRLYLIQEEISKTFPTKTNSNLERLVEINLRISASDGYAYAHYQLALRLYSKNLQESQSHLDIACRNDLGDAFQLKASYLQENKKYGEAKQNYLCALKKCHPNAEAALHQLKKIMRCTEKPLAKGKQKKSVQRKTLQEGLQILKTVERGLIHQNFTRSTIENLQCIGSIASLAVPVKLLLMLLEDNFFNDYRPLYDINPIESMGQIDMTEWKRIKAQPDLKPISNLLRFLDFYVLIKERSNYTSTLEGVTRIYGKMITVEYGKSDLSTKIDLTLKDINTPEIKKFLQSVGCDMYPIVSKQFIKKNKSSLFSNLEKFKKKFEIKIGALDEKLLQCFKENDTHGLISYGLYKFFYNLYQKSVEQGNEATDVIEDYFKKSMFFLSKSKDLGFSVAEALYVIWKISGGNKSHSKKESDEFYKLLKNAYEKTLNKDSGLAHTMVLYGLGVYFHKISKDYAEAEKFYKITLSAGGRVLAYRKLYSINVLRKIGEIEEWLKIEEREYLQKEQQLKREQAVQLKREQERQREAQDKAEEMERLQKEQQLKREQAVQLKREQERQREVQDKAEEMEWLRKEQQDGRQGGRFDQERKGCIQEVMLRPVISDLLLETMNLILTTPNCVFFALQCLFSQSQTDPYSPIFYNILGGTVSKIKQKNILTRYLKKLQCLGPHSCKNDFLKIKSNYVLAWLGLTIFFTRECLSTVIVNHVEKNESSPIIGLRFLIVAQRSKKDDISKALRIAFESFRDLKEASECIQRAVKQLQFMLATPSPHKRTLCLSLANTYRILGFTESSKKYFIREKKIRESEKSQGVMLRI